MSSPVPGAAGATARLSRLLTMVPWLLDRQGVPLAEAAAHFAISEAELVKDLELLFVCGTPGHLPDDLIEAEWESGRVYLGNADPISRPVRLGLDEAVALLAGLRTLAEVPGLHDRAVVERVLQKISDAAGEGAAAAADAVSVDLAAGLPAEVLVAARRALAGRRRLHLVYLVPSRDEATERDVDPIRLYALDGHWYLEGWCHRAEAVRRFRLDRVARIEVLEVDGVPPPEAARPESPEELFHPSPEDLLVTLDLHPGSRWVAEQYLVESRDERPDGVLRVGLRVATPDWVPRLVLARGGEVEVVAPPELARECARRAEQALAAYGAG